MAVSIGTNPVIVRRILQQLKGAGLIHVARGTGGVTITRPLKQKEKRFLVYTVKNSVIFRF